MAVVFLSHSSRDDGQAMVVEEWLVANGFSDIFVDHNRIAGDDKWREALRQATRPCRVVICLVSTSWLDSCECFGEFMAAWYMGRRIIPLFLTGSEPLTGDAAARFARVCGEDQGIDLSGCVDAAGRLNLGADATVGRRLAAGLRAAGANTRIGLDA